MIYRIVIGNKSDGSLMVQYGKDAIHHIPFFMPEEHTTTKACTYHPTLATALIAVKRTSALCRIQFKHANHTQWHDYKYHNMQQLTNDLMQF